MIKIKKSIKLLFCIMILALLVGASSLGTIKVSAEELYDEIVSVETSEQQRGLGATIDLRLNGENGIITADAYNRITWGLSTIKVYVYLYSSYTYQESYEDMTLVGWNYDADLNIFERLAISSSTNGETKYWKARMLFQYDNEPWAEVSTITLHYDSNANVID